MRSRPLVVALACGLAAAAAALAVVLVTISVADWNVTVLVRMASEQPLAPLARETDPEFAFVHYDGRGDGVAYYAVARDPLARGQEHELIEWSSYRYTHPGFSWAAWLVTLGTPALIPYAFVLLNVVAMGVAGAAASLLSRELGYTTWGGLSIALNPGLLYAATIDTTEPVAAALLAVGLLLWLRGAFTPALPVLAALCFVKEWFVLVPAGLILWELLQRRRSGTRRFLRRAAGLAASTVPFALWYVYVVIHFRGWPAAPAGDLLQFPLTGWGRTARQAADFGLQTFDRVVAGHLAVPVLAVVGLVFAIATVRALRLRNPLHPVFLAFMPVVLSLNWLNLLYAKDLIRTLSIPLALVPAVIAGGEAWRERWLTSRRALDEGSESARA